jgi:5-methylcytosine-specific restriction endonuclease McrA
MHMPIASKKKRIPNSKKWWKDPERKLEIAQKISDTRRKREGKQPLKIKRRVIAGDTIRNTPPYKLLRNFVLYRDNHTCQECQKQFKPYDPNKKGKYELHVHHIVSLHLIVVKNEIKDLSEAILCEELWDLDNLQTLCVPCHEITDSYLKRSV